MKKFLFAAVMMLASVAASAQDGKFAAGVNVNYGTASNYDALGFGAKFQYEFIDNFRAEASFNYFLPKSEDIFLGQGVKGSSDFNVWDLNLNVHYLIPMGDNFKLYPFAGLAYQTARAEVEAKAGGVTVSESESDSAIGVNVGLGAEYFVTSNIKINAEAKYQYVKDSDWPVFSIGAAYVF